jgi:hypothetical protein
MGTIKVNEYKYQRDKIIRNKYTRVNKMNQNTK